MSEALRPDLCVIGASTAGLSAASIAASFGVSVVLIEKRAMGEGGSVSGDLTAVAMRAAARSGHAPTGRKRPVPGNGLLRARALGVQVIEAEGRFVDSATIRAGDHLVRPRHVIVATGARPAIPPIPGLSNVSAWCEETIRDLDERPDHLVVLGASPTGLALGQAYRRLGSRVTILATGPRLLPDEDPEMAGVVERALLAEGIVLRTDVRIDGIEPQDTSGMILRGMRLDEPLVLSGSHLLVAMGRRPETAALRLEAAGIKADRSGAILVDHSFRSSNARVYGVGGCAGETSRHGANHQAGLAVRNALFRLPVKFDAAAIPRIVTTEPELASVGLSEEAARARHRDIRILRWPFAGNERARADGEISGHLKAVVTGRGRILGCAIAGPRAGELIAPWMLAMAKDLKVTDLAGLPVPHPTLSEAARSAGIEFLKPAAQNPWLRRVIHLTRFFGAPR